MRSFPHTNIKTSRTDHVRSKAFFVALFAVKLDADLFAAALFREDPFPRSQRRVVPHVLGVAAIEQSSPVRLIVELEIDNAVLHRLAT